MSLNTTNLIYSGKTPVLILIWQHSHSVFIKSTRALFCSAAAGARQSKCGLGSESTPVRSLRKTPRMTICADHNTASAPCFKRASARSNVPEVIPTAPATVARHRLKLYSFYALGNSIILFDIFIGVIKPEKTTFFINQRKFFNTVLLKNTSCCKICTNRAWNKISLVISGLEIDCTEIKRKISVYRIQPWWFSSVSK